MTDPSQSVKTQIVAPLSILPDTRHSLAMGTTLADRLRAAIAHSGKTQEAIESEAGLAKGYLSKLLKDPKRRLGYEKAAAIAEVTGLTRDYILSGVDVPDAAKANAIPHIPPPLERVEGYADAEIEVARLEPKIPIEVFRRARATRFDPPPSGVNSDFLRAFVVFLASVRRNVNNEAREMQTTVRARRSG